MNKEGIIYYEFYKKQLIYDFPADWLVSHPVSKYNESLLANFVRPVTIRAASCEQCENIARNNQSPVFDSIMSIVGLLCYVTLQCATINQ